MLTVLVLGAPKCGTKCVNIGYIGLPGFIPSDVVADLPLSRGARAPRHGAPRRAEHGEETCGFSHPLSLAVVRLQNGAWRAGRAVSMGGEGWKADAMDAKHQPSPWAECGLGTPL